MTFQVIKLKQIVNNHVKIYLKTRIMKKIFIMRVAVIAVIIIALGITMSSCNKKSCPAYSQQETEQTEDLG